MCISMRWKILVGFAAAFTVVFVFIAVWVFQNTTNRAFDHLSSQLHSTAVGGAESLDTQVFADLIATVPAAPDATNPTGLGYPDSPLYQAAAADLYRILQVSNQSLPYTYFRDPDDGQLYFAASSGYLLDPPQGVPYRIAARDVVNPTSYAHMERGLEQTTDEPPASDEFGRWLSTYTPVRDAAGAVIGALGVDYSLDYVDDVQSQVQREMFPVLGAAYLFLLALVLVISSAVVRPLRRLTEATGRIAEGEYDLDVASITPTRFPDEMTQLARSFAVMATKVAQRERTLTRQVQQLRIEIDAARKEESVRDIVESDFFADIAAKGAQMRRRRDEDS